MTNNPLNIECVSHLRFLTLGFHTASAVSGDKALLETYFRYLAQKQSSTRCDYCQDEKLVAFSCKKRGFCPSCGARRMADSAALLVDEVLPHQPMRQWVLSLPFPLRFLYAVLLALII